MPRRYPFVVLCLLILGSTTPAFAQSVLERVVGPTQWNEPLVLWRLDGGNIGSLALASRVPMGIESIEVPFQHKWSIPATGRKLRDVLESLVAAEPGYTWDENDGVIVIHPVVPVDDARNKLNIRIPGFQLVDVHSGGALDAFAALFGTPVPPAGPGDTKRFSVDVQDNGTIRDALNAVVRAHGTLAWAYLYWRPADPQNYPDENMFVSAVAARYDIPAALMLLVGDHGVGIGIRRDARLARVPVPSTGAVTAGGAPPSIFERIVGPDWDGQPLSIPLLSPATVVAFAQASHTPMGVETTAMERGTPQMAGQSVTVTGMRLRDALIAVNGIDARYEWREMDGVIVFRPVRAWLDGSDLLFLPVKPVQLHRASLTAAVLVIASSLGTPSHGVVADTRRISIEAPGGSVLDLLNATAKAHGELSWQFEEMSKSDQRLHEGYRYMLTITIFGAAGHVILVP
jgi:hypothetical protein